MLFTLKNTKSYLFIILLLLNVTLFMLPGLAQQEDPVRCGVKDLSSEQLQQLRKQAVQWLEEKGQPVTTVITIPVAVHVVRYDDGSADVTDQQIQDQIEVLNNSFANTNFRFRLLSIDRVNRTAWSDHRMKSQQEAEMKEALAVDPAHVLNFYICGAPRNEEGKSVLGYATFPWEYEEDSYMHGVVVKYSTLPYGSEPKFNEGDTGTHEVGHYVGLLHTFQNGCNSPGDEVDDTPYEAWPANGCPEGRDSCPDDPGEDPIHNFMDYTDDSCMDHFTSGQSERIDSKMAQYRPSMSEKILVVIDQLRFNDTRLSGTTVGRWDGSTFVELPITSMPDTINTRTNTIEILRGYQQLVENPMEKYWVWERNQEKQFDNIQNHRDFWMLSDLENLTSRFHPVYSNITLRNNLISAPYANPPDDIIEFKDPWLIDYPDPAYDNNKRNRGMDAPFKSRPSPFNPDYTTSYDGDVYQGVFLNQNPQFQQDMPVYSVRAPQQQTIPFHGKDITWYFEGWEGDNVAFQDTSKNETAVVFQADGAEARALYKGHLVSSTNGGMRYVVQRHLVYRGAKWYAVYRDGGRIYVTTSSDGSSWSREYRVSGNLDNCDHPHIAVGMEPGYVYVVWERKLSNGSYEIYFTRTTDGGSTWETPQHISTVTTTYWQAYGPQPVVAEMRTVRSGIGPNGVQTPDGTTAPPPEYDYHAVLVYVTEGGLKWRYSSNHGATWGYEQNISVPSTSTVWFPSIASGTDFIALAYSFRSNSYEVSTRIFDGSNWSAAANVSGIAGRLYDRQPSIAVTPNGELICGWHAHDNNGLYRVLLRRGYSDNTWQSSYEEITPHSNINEGHPSVSFWNGGEVDVVWFDNSQNQYRRQYSNGFSSYTETMISTNGLHGNLPLYLRDDYTSSIVMWTEKTGQPYLIKSTAGVNYTSNSALASVSREVTGQELVVTQPGLSQRFVLKDVSLDDAYIAFQALPEPMPVRLVAADVPRFVRTQPITIDGSGVLQFSTGMQSDGGVVDTVGIVEASTSSHPVPGYVELVNEAGKVVYRQAIVSGEKVYRVPVGMLEGGQYYLRLVVGQVPSGGLLGIRELRQRVSVVPTAALGSSDEEFLEVGDQANIPESFILEPAYPNPFNPSTTLRYGLPEAAKVTLAVYSIQGQRVRTVVAGSQSAGWHVVQWDGRGDDGQPVASGVYLVRLTARPSQDATIVRTQKVILMK